MSRAGGTSTTLSHAVNETNEITTLGYDNPAGPHGIIRDPFTTTLSDIWTADKGTWSISSGQVNVDTLTSGKALMSASPTHLDTAFYTVKFTPPVARVMLASCGPGRGPDAGVVPAFPVAGRSRSLRSPPPAPPRPRRA